MIGGASRLSSDSHHNALRVASSFVTMSESLTPWIEDYVINVAEEYGANATNTTTVPLSPKKKKAQLIKVRDNW
jgi:hypothetical protein